MLADSLTRAGIAYRHTHSGTQRIACPMCPPEKARKPALSLTIEGDSAVWLCFRCGWKGNATERRTAVAESAPRIARPRPDRAERNRSVRQHAREIWRECVPLPGTDGAAYLELRRCALPHPEGDIRFHPSLHCPEVNAKLPAIVAKVTSVIGNRDIGIHRVWIRPGEAKAVAKMRLGGCDEPVCVRLWPDEEITQSLGVAEGIETALAAANTYRPMWATVDAGQMTKFPVVAGLETLVIFADFDEAGLKAADALQSRYLDAGRQALRIRSRNAGEDFNDVVRRAAA